MSRRQLTPEVLAEEGREAVLEVSFCSDPLPTLSVWHWGSLQLQTGHSQGRFTADQVTQVSREGREGTQVRREGCEVTQVMREG